MKPVATFWLLSAALGLWFAAQSDTINRDWQAFQTALSPAVTPPSRRAPSLPSHLPGLSAPAPLPPAASPPLLLAERPLLTPIFQNATLPKTPQSPAFTPLPALPRPAIIPAPDPTPPAPPQEHPTPAPTAWSLADAGYRAQRNGERAKAHALLMQAIALAPENDGARLWARDAAALTRRWSGSAYALMRAGTPGLLGTTGSGAALGGDQAGLTAAFKPAPLTAPGLAVIARLASTLDHPDKTAQAAVGLAVQPEALPNLTLTAERLVALGKEARADWLIRAGWGTTHALGTTGRQIEGYGEAALIGGTDRVAAAQIRLLERPTSLAGRSLRPYAALYTAGQWTANSSATSIEAAVGIELGHTATKLHVEVRTPLAGNATPKTGVALTLSTNF